MLSCFSPQKALCLSHACGNNTKIPKYQNTKCQIHDYQVPCPRRCRGKNIKRTKIENTRIPGSNRNKNQQKGEKSRFLVQDVVEATIPKEPTQKIQKHQDPCPSFQPPNENDVRFPRNVLSCFSPQMAFCLSHACGRNTKIPIAKYKITKTYSSQQHQKNLLR